MSTAEIAEMFGTTHHSVLSRLKTLGISRRKGGVSRNVNCDEPGCIEPVLKLKHPQRGYMYGTKCAEHYHAHRKSLYASRYERIKIAKGNITRRILLQLKAGFTTSREIAQRLNVTVQVVATSMGRLKQRGEVEAYGSVMVDRVEQKLWRLVER
jgi:DNA-binding CsgD family transcriptional regulator